MWFTLSGLILCAYILLRLSCNETLLPESIFLLFMWCAGFGVVQRVLNYKGGYLLEEKNIYYYRNFKKKQLNYGEMSGIVISNAVALHRTTYLGKWKRFGKTIKFVVYPWITLTTKEIEQIQDLYCEEELLEGKTVDYLLKDKGYAYSFVWNEERIQYLLANYKGTYYLASSIERRFRSVIKLLMKEYKISSSQIQILEDVSTNRILWKKYE